MITPLQMLFHLCTQLLLQLHFSPSWSTVPQQMLVFKEHPLLSCSLSPVPIKTPCQAIRQQFTLSSEFPPQQHSQTCHFLKAHIILSIKHLILWQSLQYLHYRPP